MKGRKAPGRAFYIGKRRTLNVASVGGYDYTPAFFDSGPKVETKEDKGEGHNYEDKDSI